MFPPKEKEGVPDLQLSFVFGKSVVKPQTPCCLPEDAGPQELAQYYSAETLCLSRTKLKHVSDSILKNNTLKHLYLEGNHICSIPESLFISLPNLQWLDLRNNQIASLPAEIGMHRSLRTLLLETNPISELPLELGNVISLKGLNLRNCPIIFPPQDIVHQGLQSILQYLRNAMAKRPVIIRKTPSVVELPVVEKLHLSELGSSIEEQDESVDEGELQKFKELKDKMILLDEAELGSVADPNPKSVPPIIKKKKTSTKACIVPELDLLGSQRYKRPDEQRQAAAKELKEKQALVEQRRKSHEALQKWRTQAKIIQQKKMSEHKQKKGERQRKAEEAEADVKSVLDSSYASQRQTPITSITEFEQTRSARVLERQIRARVEKMQERRRIPRGNGSEEMAAAEQDVEEIRKLQSQLLDRKRNLKRDSDKRITIFSEDTWPSFLYK